MLRLAWTAVTLPLSILGLVLKLAGMLLMLAAVTAAVVTGLFLYNVHEARADGPGQVYTNIHLDRTQPEAGTPVEVTVTVSNPPPNQATELTVVLELDDGVTLESPGTWADCSPAGCRSGPLTLETGLRLELTATIALSDPGATRTITAVTQHASGENAPVRTEKRVTAWSAAAEDSVPQTSGRTPPEPTPAPVRPGRPIHIIEKRVPWSTILGVAGIVTLAAIALLGLGGVRLPRPSDMERIWPAARRARFLRVKGDAGAGGLMSPGHSGAPYYTAVAGAASYLIAGGSPSVIALAFPLAAMGMAQWNRRSRVLYWTLTALGGILVLYHIGKKVEGEGPDAYASAMMAVLAVAAGTAAWAWHKVMEKIRGTEEEPEEQENAVAP